MEHGRNARRRSDASASIPAKILAPGATAARSRPTTSEVARRVSLLRDHGRLSHYVHEICGYNARLDTMQAAVLRAKLEKLDEWNERRREIAAAIASCSRRWTCGRSSNPKARNPATICS